MAMILVAILNERTLDQWYDWIADRVEQKVGYHTPKDTLKSSVRAVSSQPGNALRHSGTAIEVDLVLAG